MIIIFGGSGFIGTALRSELDKRNVCYLSPNGNEIDLRYEDSREKIANIVNDGDIIIMISAYTNEHGDACQLTDWNVRMAANVAVAIREKKIAHFVYISSDSVYGKGNIVTKIMDENTIIHPEELYGFMHATREQYFRQYIPSEKLTVFRPCSIYGVGDTHNSYGVNRFIREAKKSGTINLFGNGEEMRPNVHVDDVASIIATSAMKRISGVFNINPGASFTFKEIANMVKNAIGKHIKIINQQRTAIVTHRIFDNSKLTKTFFPPVTPDIGIPKMIKFMENI